MKKKIGEVLHLIYIGGVYVFGIFVISKFECPDFVYLLWLLTYLAGYIAHDFEHGEWPEN